MVKDHQTTLTFAQFLVEEGIDTISVTPDSMLKAIKAIHKIETKK